MKVSTITINDLKNYLRLDDNSFDTELGIHLNAAKEYVKSYIGLPLTSSDQEEETIDSHEDITTAIFILVSDFFENHLYHQGGVGQEVKTNKLVETILNQYRRNLV